MRDRRREQENRQRKLLQEKLEQVMTARERSRFAF